MTNQATQSKAVLRIGILGCANIARQFTRDVAPSRRIKVAAVASRNAETAAAFAAATGIPRHHGSYEALLADPGIDAIYLPLPNNLHAEWAIRAAEHGKHILCEKPLALNAGEVRAMFDAARKHGVMLLESYPWLFQPYATTMLTALRNGEIGTVRSIQASFGFTLGNPSRNIRMKPELGGGALLDAGSYPLSLIRWVMGDAPERVMAQARSADTGVDIATAATLYWADGRIAQMSCAMDAATHRHATIVGTQGTIYTEYLNHTSRSTTGHPYGYQPSELRMRRGIANTVPVEQVVSPVGSGFLFAADGFARMVAERDTAAMEYGAAASVDIAAMLDAIALSARTLSPARLQANATAPGIAHNGQP
jgi:predicted dehydrogenase